MSANKDQSQKVTFLYSNLYSIYQKGKKAAQEAKLPEEPDAQLTEQIAAIPLRPFGAETPELLGLTVGKVIKTENLNETQVEPFKPVEFLSKRQESQTQLISSSDAVENLKKNLQELHSLHDRLKFMLQELEDLTREDE